MDVLIRSDVLLFGECLELGLRNQPDVSVVSVVTDDDALRNALDRLPVDLVLYDISQGVDAGAARRLVHDYPGILLLAVGLHEHEDNVVRCGAAGFAGYVPKHASMAQLRQAMLDAMSGRQSCPESITAGLLRALARGPVTSAPEAQPSQRPVLSSRESTVARLVGRGYSNKEIARELNISVATVKHHVHRVLEKLRVTRRGQVGPASGSTSATGTDGTPLAARSGSNRVISR